VRLEKYSGCLLRISNKSNAECRVDFEGRSGICLKMDLFQGIC